MATVLAFQQIKIISHAWNALVKHQPAVQARRSSQTQHWPQSDQCNLEHSLFTIRVGGVSQLMDPEECRMAPTTSHPQIAHRPASSRASIRRFWNFQGPGHAHRFLLGRNLGIGPAAAPFDSPRLDASSRHHGAHTGLSLANQSLCY